MAATMPGGICRFVQFAISHAPMDPLSWPKRFEVYYGMLTRRPRRLEVSMKPEVGVPSPPAPAPAPAVDESMWPLVAAALVYCYFYLAAPAPSRPFTVTTPAGLRQALALTAADADADAAAAAAAVPLAVAAAAGVGPVPAGLMGQTGMFVSPTPSASRHSLHPIGFILAIVLAFVPVRPHPQV